jgi:hypothetical protein
MTDTNTVDRLVIGDTMRISVELIRACAALPNFSSVLVRVKEIQREADGSKTVIVEDAARRA